MYTISIVTDTERIIVVKSSPKGERVSVSVGGESFSLSKVDAERLAEVLIAAARIRTEG